MSIFRFCFFMDYEEGKMARVETTGEYEIPVNIHIDNADEIEDFQEEYCEIEVCGIGNNVLFYSSEEDYNAADSKMAVISMIPMGTFSVDPDDNTFEESPHILFTGKVLDVEWDSSADDDEPNCCILIETLGMMINLYIRYNAPIEEGYIIHGVAWLFGDLKKNTESS